MWYSAVIALLRAAALFKEVAVVGGRVRAGVDAHRFLDIYSDPTSGSYSYAFIDLALPCPGDKRLFGGDDYPHEGVSALARLPTHPRHFQYRAPDGSWMFEASAMRGNVEAEIPIVVEVLREQALDT